MAIVSMRVSKHQSIKVQPQSIKASAEDHGAWARGWKRSPAGGGETSCHKCGLWWHERMEVRLSAHGAYRHQYYVVWIPKYRRRILWGAIRLFVQEHVAQMQYDHPDVELQQWSVQVDHIHVVMVIPPKYAGSSIVGKMKANLSRQLRLRYPELKGMYWGAVLWSPGFFLRPLGWMRRWSGVTWSIKNEWKGQIQLEFEC